MEQPSTKNRFLADTRVCGSSSDDLARKFRGKSYSHIFDPLSLSRDASKTLIKLQIFSSIESVKRSLILKVTKHSYFSLVMVVKFCILTSIKFKIIYGHYTCLFSRCDKFTRNEKSWSDIFLTKYIVMNL